MADLLTEQMARHAGDLAVATAAGSRTYCDLLAALDSWRQRIDDAGVGPGAVATVEGEYGPDTIGAFLALTAARNIVVPLSRDSQTHAEAFADLAEVEWRISVRPEPFDKAQGGALEGGTEIVPTGRRATHEHYRTLRTRNAPGLVLFSSGSTGRHKAAVHDLSLLLKKFHTPRQRLRTLVFLQLDHIGGVNTLLYTLSNGGAAVVPPDRSPATVCEAIERYRVELLPTSPTFLNLLLLSGEHLRHNLSSLQLITYGTETMPESTLRRVHEAFPGARLQQTYGLTELGILRSQSRGNDSLWVRVGGEGYQTKVANGKLWIKAESAMLGYLNAPSPFDSAGYFDTGDRVEVDGEWLRILGRESEIINVGGSKVYPAEVEDALLELDDLTDVTV
ncbi:MAG: long-chain fatty acid--CoA ligase, partial [Spirochaetes bacterium]|nr:long-chain fatty acid--CoA ligase [Spirochaetota bacterium]